MATLANQRLTGWQESGQGHAPLPVFRAIIVLGFILAGQGLSTGLVTELACLAILIGGLPHGALDIDVIRAGSSVGLRWVFTLYIALAAIMACAWWLSPAFALAVFLILSVVHFAEDWDAAGDPFLAIGIALAIIAAPAVAHPGQIAALFVALTGSADAAVCADILRLLAPTAFIAAAIGLATMGRRGDNAGAARGTLSIVAMTALPPVVGFACFFCLFHSPHNLAGTFATLRRTRNTLLSGGIVPFSIGGALIALLIAAVTTRPSLSDVAVTASFTTLSILTVPHMIAPAVVSRWSRFSLR